MIPKIIHYCWFGGKPLPEDALKYIESWKKYCPDYEIREWNETNLDLQKYPYAQEACWARKWAFVSDVARLYVLAEYGGIYMDTDVELLKPLDSILNYHAVSGFETENRVPTGLLASEKGQDIILELLSEYEHAHFLKPDSTIDYTTNVTRITNTLLKYGLVLDGKLQTVHGFTLFPKDCFCAKNPNTGEYHVTENTIAIHHFSGSWIDPNAVFRGKIYAFIRDHFGENCAEFVKRILGRHRKPQ